MSAQTTLQNYISSDICHFTEPKNELSALMNSISVASKTIDHTLKRLALEGLEGAAGNVNIQGEDQQKLDVYANDVFLAAFKETGLVAGVGSEENDDYIFMDENAKYIIMMDPLDGSSNIDVNVSVGTIFGIFKRLSPKGKLNEGDFLQPGKEQICAGYVIYGSGTQLIFTTGNGVNAFTLDPKNNKYVLSHKNMKSPEKGTIYSINEANFVRFEKGLQNYVTWCKQIDTESNRPYTARYIGSLVADFHRNLLKGGIYIYPKTTIAPQGKMRLLFECNPLAMVAEQANAMATDGHTNILDYQPTELHQRCPYYIGSPEMVKNAMKHLNNN